jgi:hypothetical protein
MKQKVLISVLLSSLAAQDRFTQRGVGPSCTTVIPPQPRSQQ